MSREINIVVKSIKVITYRYKRRPGKVLINPVTGEELTKRKISIEGHLL